MERLREEASRLSWIGSEIEAARNGKSSLVEANNRPDFLRYHLPFDYKCLAELPAYYTLQEEVHTDRQTRRKRVLSTSFNFNPEYRYQSLG